MDQKIIEHCHWAPVVLIVAVIALASCKAKVSVEHDGRAPEQRVQQTGTVDPSRSSGMMAQTWIDPVTKCQYFVGAGGVMTPRLVATGKPMCDLE